MEISVNSSSLTVKGDEISRFVSGEYEKLEFSLTYGCQDIIRKEISNLPPERDYCGTVSDVYFYMLELGAAKNQTNVISGIRVTNLENGEVVTSEANISFDEYNTACPTGCLFDTQSAYYTPLFKSAIDDAFEKFEGVSSNATIILCEDDIVVKDTPFASKIEFIFDNGVVSTFEFGGEKYYVLANERIYISSDVIDVSEFKEGVYGIRVRITKSDGSTLESTQCYFHDVELKCEVSKYMKDLMEASTSDKSEILHILHYSLVNSSNCGNCKCTNMCSMYDTIKSILSGKSIKTAINISNSGCSTCE